MSEFKQEIEDNESHIKINLLENERTPGETPVIINHTSFDKDPYTNLKTPVKSQNEEVKSQVREHTAEKLVENEKDEKNEQPVEKKKQKMIITGDDILIEYVNRIIRHLESVCVVFHKKYNQKIERVDDILPQSLRNTLEKFSMHTIWSTKLNSQQKLAPLNHKIKIRHKEMVDRRTKILTSMMKKNNKNI